MTKPRRILLAIGAALTSPLWLTVGAIVLVALVLHAATVGAVQELLEEDWSQ